MYRVFASASASADNPHCFDIRIPRMRLINYSHRHSHLLFGGNNYSHSHSHPHFTGADIADV